MRFRADALSGPDPVKRGMIYLLIALPLASVIMGMVTLYVALAEQDPVVTESPQALSKTSWRGAAQQQGQPQ